MRAVVTSTTELVLAAHDGHLEALDSWAAIDRWLAHTLALQSDPPNGCRSARSSASSHARGLPCVRSLPAGSSAGSTRSAHGLATMAAHGKLRPGRDPTQLATATLAAIQGGLLLSHVHRDAEPLRRALTGARAMLGAFGYSRNVKCRREFLVWIRHLDLDIVRRALFGRLIVTDHRLVERLGD